MYFTDKNFDYKKKWIILLILGNLYRVATKRLNVLNKHNFYKHMFFKFFILFENVINGFFFSIMREKQHL